MSNEHREINLHKMFPPFIGEKDMTEVINNLRFKKWKKKTMNSDWLQKEEK